MPPSPRLKATIDHQQLDQLCSELRVTVPPIVVRSGRGPDRRYGDYNFDTGEIRLFLGGGRGEYEFDSLAAAQRVLVRTFLHELRHHWQNTYRRGFTHDQREHDAESWARLKVADHRNIIRLSRSYPNSGFSRLSRHAVRRGV